MLCTTPSQIHNSILRSPWFVFISRPNRRESAVRLFIIAIRDILPTFYLEEQVLVRAYKHLKICFALNSKWLWGVADKVAIAQTIFWPKVIYRICKFLWTILLYEVLLGHCDTDPIILVLKPRKNNTSLVLHLFLDFCEEIHYNRSHFWASQVFFTVSFYPSMQH